MIIGVTGTKVSGKGFACELLKKDGYKYESTSEVVRDECQRIYGTRDPEIAKIQDTGNKLREEGGIGVLTNIILERNKGIENLVIDGIRNPGEIEAIVRAGGYIIAIDAPPEDRYKRIIERARPGDPKTWEEFQTLEKRDLGLGELTSGQQVARCMELADYFFLNPNLETDKFELKEQYKQRQSDVIRKMLYDKKTGAIPAFAGKRKPTFPELFMKEGYTWATRSSCSRRSVGAVAVSPENVLLSQGYNGAPRGCKDCKEIGTCLRQEKNVPSGEREEICRAIHAEMNCIINAGLNKVSLENATIYCTTKPCSTCAKHLLNSKVKKIIYREGYNSAMNEFLDQMNPERYVGINPKRYDRIFLR